MAAEAVEKLEWFQTLKHFTTWKEGFSTITKEKISLALWSGKPTNNCSIYLSTVTQDCLVDVCP